MPDLGRDVRLARDAERLVQRLVDLPTLVAHVGRVHAAVAPSRLRERDDLLGRSVDGGCVLERCRQPEGSLLHRGVDQSHHVCQLFGRGVAVLLADHGEADLRRPDERGDVDGAPGAREVREVAVQIAPILLDAVLLHPRGIVNDEQVGEGRDRTAFTGDFRRDALGHLAEDPVVDQDAPFRLTEHVDEAGRDDEPANVERVTRRGGPQIPDGRDTIVRDRDIAQVARVTASVHD